MKNLIIVLLFLCSCAGSNFAVKQNELEKRGKGGPRTVILKR